MTRASAYTSAIAVAAILAVAVAVAPALAPARLVLSPLLILLLPGLAVTRLIFRDEDGAVVTLALGCGLSMAIAVIAGLALHFAASMNPRAWACSLGGVTIIACALRLFFSSKPNGRSTEAKPFGSLSLAQSLLFAVAAIISTGGVVLARQGALSQHEYAYTEFWMMPQHPADQNIVTIGVHNEEKVRTAYRVVMISDRAMIGRWPYIELEPGATWTTQMSLNEQLQHNQRVEAWLYRSDSPDEVYRKVWLTSASN